MISEDGRERLFNCLALLVIKHLFNHCLCLRFREPQLSMTTVEQLNVPSRRKANGHMSPAVFKVRRCERGTEEVRVEEASAPSSPPPVQEALLRPGLILPAVILPTGSSGLSLFPAEPSAVLPSLSVLEFAAPAPSPRSDETRSTAPPIPTPEPKVDYTLLRPSFSTLRPSRSVRTFEYLILEKEARQAPAPFLLSQHAHYFLGTSFR